MVSKRLLAVLRHDKGEFQLRFDERALVPLEDVLQLPIMRNKRIDRRQIMSAIYHNVPAKTIVMVSVVGPSEVVHAERDRPPDLKSLRQSSVYSPREAALRLLHDRPLREQTCLHPMQATALAMLAECFCGTRDLCQSQVHGLGKIFFTPKYESRTG